MDITGDLEIQEDVGLKAQRRSVADDSRSPNDAETSNAETIGLEL